MNMLAAGIVIVLLAMLLGALLGWLARRFRVGTDPMVERINRLLPQTQCGQCNFAGCKPYAEAIAAGVADINQCPPGGDAGVRALARLLGREGDPRSRRADVAIEPSTLSVPPLTVVAPV